MVACFVDCDPNSSFSFIWAMSLDALTTGKFEIVSLTGTLGCDDKPHVHMSISDADCNVFGGHVVEGSKVANCAETDSTFNTWW